MLVIYPSVNDDLGRGVEPEEQPKPSSDLGTTPVTEISTHRIALSVFLPIGIARNGLDLLAPQKAPALAGMDLIVESHECLVPGITKALIERFSSTHDITVIEDNGQRQLPNAPTWFNNLAHLDQLLAVWEWRSGPTPWLVMKRKRK